MRKMGEEAVEPGAAAPRRGGIGGEYYHPPRAAETVTLSFSEELTGGKGKCHRFGVGTGAVGGHGSRPLMGFLGSCVYIVGMLSSAAFGVYPYVLPARPDSSLGLTIHNSAAGPYGLWVGLLWYIPGMLLALGYFVFAYRHFSGKVRLGGEGY